MQCTSLSSPVSIPLFSTVFSFLRFAHRSTVHSSSLHCIIFHYNLHVQNTHYKLIIHVHMYTHFVCSGGRTGRDGTGHWMCVQWWDAFDHSHLCLCIAYLHSESIRLCSYSYLCSYLCSYLQERARSGRVGAQRRTLLRALSRSLRREDMRRLQVRARHYDVQYTEYMFGRRRYRVEKQIILRVYYFTLLDVTSRLLCSFSSSFRLIFLPLPALHQRTVLNI